MAFALSGPGEKIGLDDFASRVRERARAERHRIEHGPAEFIAEGETYDRWLARHFPRVASAPLGERHVRLWKWFDGLAPGFRPDPLVEVWPRAGAKSETAELGTAYIGSKLSRRFVAYVSATQDQADAHVSTISKRLETLGHERALNKYGMARSWRRNEIRAANGFNVVALGLDSAARGIKFDELRPDLIIFDDVDNREDHSAITERKERAITQTILPAGSPDCAILFIQNLIIEDGIVGRLASKRATFLMGRTVSEIEPAVRGLEYEDYETENGARAYRITAGEATWVGQPLATCEAQLNDWGPRAFLREAQHDVRSAQGYFFDSDRLRAVSPIELPRMLRVCLAWDLAATEGGGDYTAGVLMGIGANRVVYVLKVWRGQWAPDNVRANLVSACEEVWEGYECPKTLHMPQDPSQAGKDQAVQYGRLLARYAPKFESVRGEKAKRSEPWAAKVNVGNAAMVEAPWNYAFAEEHRQFRADEKHDFDDQVDAASDAYVELESPPIEIEIGFS